VRPTPTAPDLDTARLSLRGHAPADLDEAAAMWADPEVTRHITGRPSTAEETWARMLRSAGLWAMLGMGYWVVRERATGRFVGEVGLADFRRDITPPLAGAAEAGWVLATWAHGRGYATEAVRAALAWGDANLSSPGGGPPRYACIVAPGNAASIRVAQKCGFREVARTTYHGEATLVLERPAG
jgi:RimJ/RimL family protein N-acetyltransferase